MRINEPLTRQDPGMGQAVFEQECEDAAVLVVDFSIFDLCLMLVAYNLGVSYMYKHDMNIASHAPAT